MNRIILILTAILISTSAWANVPNATPLFNQYTCNSSTTQFPYAFQITTSSDMTVYLTDTSGTTTQLSNSVFSVDTTNLWVNYPLIGSPCATNYVLTLRPSTPQTQTTTYGNRTPFTATAVGSSLDKLTLISQQLQGQINRTFLQPANVTAQVTFPSSSPGNYIGWNGSGVLTNIPSPANAALWTLSGANAQYNSGNVSTTNNMTATYFNGTHNGDINWPSVVSLLKSANMNWPDINGNATIGSGGVNWNDINRLSKLNYGGINWPSTNIFPTSSTGNVGIGSSNPGVQLDINGTIRATTYSGQTLSSITAYGSSSSSGSSVNGSSLKIVYGTISVASSQSISNLPFSSSSSYSCTCAWNTNPSAVACQSTPTSGSAVTLAWSDSGTHAMNWVCVGT